MNLVKNKATGKYFVVLDDTGGLDFLVVTPQGKVKQLDRHLFDAQYIVDPVDIPRRQQLTAEQLAIYETYFDKDR